MDCAHRMDVILEKKSERDDLVNQAELFDPPR